jgi:hypothetical protein
MSRGGRSSASSTAFVSMGLNASSMTMRGMSCTPGMIAAIKRLSSSIGSAQRTLRGGGAPRCSASGITAVLVCDEDRDDTEVEKNSCEGSYSEADMREAPTGRASAAGALALLAAVAISAGWAAQQASAGAAATALATTTSSLAAFLSSQQPASAAGKKGPEIPDPHPDPDPWPYPGHPARSPTARRPAAKKQAPHATKALFLESTMPYIASTIPLDAVRGARRPAAATGLAAKQAPHASKAAKRQQKTLRQDRQGIVAEPQLGRTHGCAPEQIIIMPQDDCDPLAAKMQPAIDRFAKREQDEHGDNFAGVHWTSGDVGPDTDAFPYFEHHGGYSGFGFQDVIYDSKNGVHPTLYKPTVGYERHKYTMGTSIMKGKTDHSLKEYNDDNKQMAMLIAEGNHDLIRSKTAAPSEAVRLLRDATVDFKAAHEYKTRLAAGADKRSKGHVRAAEAAPLSREAQKMLANALQPHTSKEVQAYVKGLRGNDDGGLLLNAVGAISREMRQLRDVAERLQTGNDDTMARVSRETLDVKAALAALDTAASGSSNVISSPPLPPSFAGV